MGGELLNELIKPSWEPLAGWVRKEPRPPMGGGN